jgi:hypothetical protein
VVATLGWGEVFGYVFFPFLMLSCRLWPYTDSHSPSLFFSRLSCLVYKNIELYKRMGKETRAAKQANANRQLGKAVERVRKRGVGGS